MNSRGRTQDGQRDKLTSDAGPTGNLRDPLDALGQRGPLERNVLRMV